MILKNKTAVIYGAAGSIGSSVARVFAVEGARLFLAGRNRASIQKVAELQEKTGSHRHNFIIDINSILYHIASWKILPLSAAA